MRLRGEKECFAQLVLDHRDYFTHWFDKKKNKVLKPALLLELARDTNLLLEMCLLMAAGFEKPEIFDMVKGCQYTRRIIEIGRPNTPNVYPPKRIQWSQSELSDNCFQLTPMSLRSSGPTEA